MKRGALLLLLFFLVGNYSCTKKEIIYENEHIEVVIDGNEPPPYSGVTTVQIQGYINRMYIDLIGREPTAAERESDVQYLKNNDLSDNAREFVLSQLMSSGDYYKRFSTIYKSELLDGVTDMVIQGQAALLNSFYDIAVNAGDLTLAQVYLRAFDKMIALQNAPTNYQNGTISINEFFAILIDNPIFDDINMGSENFVNACFEGLLKRLPTETELNAGISMVDGFSAQLLLTDGNGKTDFINILTTVDGFYEGLTIDIYQLLLARAPNSQEMGVGTIELATTGNYQMVQKKVMKTDEYAGF